MRRRVTIATLFAIACGGDPTIDDPGEGPADTAGLDQTMAPRAAAALEAIQIRQYQQLATNGQSLSAEDDGISVEWTRWGTVHSIVAHRAPLPVEAPPGASPETVALQSLSELAPALGLTDLSSLGNARRRTARDGRVVIELDQYLDGLPIWGANARVVVDSSGRVRAMTSSLLPVRLSPSSEPLIDSEAAASIVRDLGDAPVAPVVLGVWVSPDPSVRTPRLAWRGRTNHTIAYVDASSGAVLSSRPFSVGDQHAESLYRDTYGSTPTVAGDSQCHTGASPSCNVTGDAACPVACSTSCTNSGAPAAATQIYSHLSATLTFLSVRLGRDSWNDDPGSSCHRLRANLNTNPADVEEAIWQGEFAPDTEQESIIVGLDHTCQNSIAHEAFHGVDEGIHGNSPVYNSSGETATLAEGISDVFAELVEAYAAGAAPDWIHNTSCGPSARRSNLADPPLYTTLTCSGPDPDTWSNYQKPFTFCPTTYSNIGILGKAAYLASRSVGANPITHYGVPVAGIGRPALEKVLYSCLETDLTPTSTFVEYAQCMVSAAADLGYDFGRVQDSLDSVGIWRPYKMLWTIPSTYVATTHQVDSGGTDRRWAFYESPLVRYAILARRTCGLEVCPNPYGWHDEVSIGMSLRGGPATELFGHEIYVCGANSANTSVLCRKLTQAGGLVNVASPPGTSDKKVSLVSFGGALYLFKKAAGTGARAVTWNRFDFATGTWSVSMTTPISTDEPVSASADSTGVWVVYRRATDGRIGYRKLTDVVANTWTNQVLLPAKADGIVPLVSGGPAAAVFRDRLHVVAAHPATGGDELRYMSCALPCSGSGSWTKWVLQDSDVDAGTTTIDAANPSGALQLNLWRRSATGQLIWKFKVSE